MLKLRDKLGITATVLAGLIAGVFLFAGCGQMGSNPVAPTAEEPQPVFSILGGALDLVNNIVNVEETLGVLGGIISTDGGLLNTSTFYVPPGALDSTVTITLRVETNLIRATFNLLNRLLSPSGQVTEFDFGPDGLRFNKACTLTKQTGQPDGRVMTLWYFNPRTNAWERVDQAPSRGGKVSFSIYHFSKYAIS
jgi:hypothetical protein